MVSLFEGIEKTPFSVSRECDTESKTDNDDENRRDQSLRQKGGGLLLNLYEDVIFKYNLNFTKSLKISRKMLNIFTLISERSN